jgi:hypothetical protein
MVGIAGAEAAGVDPPTRQSSSAMRIRKAPPAEG